MPERSTALGRPADSFCAAVPSGPESPAQ